MQILILTVISAAAAWGQNGMSAARMERAAGLIQAEVDAGKYKEAVENEVKQGEIAGVQGTPSFFFNGRRYSGAFQADAVAQLLQTEFKIAPR